LKKENKGDIIKSHGRERKTELKAKILCYLRLCGKNVKEFYGAK